MKGSSKGAHTSSFSHHEEHIRALCEDGQLQSALSHTTTSPPSSKTYLSLFKACIKSKCLTHARLLHAHLTHHGIHISELLGGFLVVTLAKCGAIEDALNVSRGLPHRTVFSWTAIIFAYVECGSWLQALDTFRSMQDDGVSPNAFTYASLFKACGNLMDLAQGRTLHTDAQKNGFTSEVFVGNTLVSMYGKLGALQEAENVFCALPTRTVVSWTAMLAVYLEQGQAGRALQVYKQMHEDDTCPNRHTVVFALQACNILVDGEKSVLTTEGRVNIIRALEIGHALHADALKRGLACDVVVGTALLCLYGKCGAVGEAEKAFQALSRRDIVSWNAMLSTYNDQLQEEIVLLLYTHMHGEGVRPNQLTFVIALEACRNMAQKDASFDAMTLDIGRAFHSDIKKNGYASDVLVGTALVSMYGKCGVVLDAEMVFDTLPQRNVVTWTTMLSAYVEQAQGEKALALYSQMQKEDVALDDVILLGILQSCGETGYLDLCKRLHFNITSAGSDRVPFVVATLIHAYGRCASMLDGLEVFCHLVQPALESWNACIVGYAGEGNSLASMRMFEELKMAGMKPDGVTFNGVLSVCCHAGLIVNSSRYFESMSREHGVTPDLKHHANMADLLGRAGDVEEAYRWLRQMPMQADPAIWSCLLGSCRIHGNIELAKEVYEHAVSLHPQQVGTYVLMSNIYVMESAAQLENA